MLDCIEIETGKQPRHSVLWLHGLGADGHDFEPIVPELTRAGWPPLRFVFPHAPVRPITLNAGMRMRGWYDIQGLELMAIEDEPGILASVAAVERLIARERQRGVDSQRILLAGFSQGGAVALAAGLTHPERLAGLVALSTYLPIAAHIEAQRAPIQAGLPVFMGHGAVDPIVPQMLGLAARQRLQTWGHPVDWHSYGMPHSVCAEEIRDLSGWMERHLLGEQR
ncbi:alpha/beta hydrolase [Aquimonas voraii]|uniref:Phospholipase/carboxylesterase n=1 Tax=Aquimonas voraii TaxID=265719 RepID=A0A1G6XZQ5_9GAMM|nr:alpha/beta fold hydrolase [Aquimonas voraii]SDD83511.1 phospholipase/carboxylesterase [Aquimonas voraii]